MDIDDVAFALREIQVSELRVAAAQEAYKAALESKLASMQELQSIIGEAMAALARDDIVEASARTDELALAHEALRDGGLEAAKTRMDAAEFVAIEGRGRLGHLAGLVARHEQRVLRDCFRQVSQLLDVCADADWRPRLELLLSVMPLVAANGYATEVVEYILFANPFDELRLLSS